MSATATEPAVIGTEAHDVNDPGMGGTSTEGDVQAVGTEDEGQQDEQPEGVSPEGESDATGEEPEVQTKAPDAAYVAALEERAQTSEFLSKTIMSDPARLRAFQEWAKADQGGVVADPMEAAESGIKKWFSDSPDNAEALREIIGPLAQKIRDQDAVIRGMQPHVERSSRLAQTNEFAGSIAEHGVSLKEQASPEFKAFIAAERRDPEFQRDEAKRPAYAGKNLARAWVASRSKATVNASARQHVSDLKGGRLHASAASGSAGASRVTVIDSDAPGWDKALLKMLEKNPAMKWEYKKK